MNKHYKEHKEHKDHKDHKLSKVSIREFVSESDILFELYHMKYSNQLRQLDEMTTEEIEAKWLYNNIKKANRYKNELKKPANNNPIAQKALNHNINYILNLPAPTTKKIIQDNFNIKLQEYKSKLKQRLQDNIDDPKNNPLPLSTIKKIQDTLVYLKDIEQKGLQKRPNKERFGAMLLLIIKNLATMPSFSGYSENWTSDFYSNAVEKTILYLDNFDEELLSKRTGNKSKAFAYITQICFNAFINIINIRKAEQEMLKDTISYETHNIDGVKKLSRDRSKNRSKEEDDTLEISPHTEIKRSRTYIVKLSKKDIKGTKGTKGTIEALNNKIKKAISFVQDLNEIINTNKAIINEINDLKRPGYIPETEKTKDYYDYIEELESKITPTNMIDTINTILIQKPENIDLTGVEINNPDNDLTIIISSNDSILDKSEKANKAKKGKRTKRTNKNTFNGSVNGKSAKEIRLEEQKEQKQEELIKIEEFDNEW